MNTDNKKILAIYGASGLGREVRELAGIINRQQNRWADFIFVDDGDVPRTVSETAVYPYVDAAKKYGGSLEFVIAVGEPAVRELLFRKVSADGYALPALVHPETYVPKTATVGAGAVVQASVFLSCGAVIGCNAYVQPLTGIGHDCVLGAHSVISSLCALAGATRVGDRSYIGMSSCVREGVSIGSDCIVGMASAVHRDIPDGMIAMGNPARVIQRNDTRRVFGKRHNESKEEKDGCR